jgi:hypothetical protein
MTERGRYPQIIVRRFKRGIINRLVEGHNEYEPQGNWLRTAHELTQKYSKYIGKKETAQAWMQAISELAETEIEVNETLETRAVEDFLRPFSTEKKLQEAAGEVRKGAEKILRQLMEVGEYAIQNRILDRKDVDLSHAAGKMVYDEVEGMRREEDRNFDDVTTMADLLRFDHSMIRARINERLEKS